MSPSDETTFDEDISPLLQYLWRNELVSADVRLGLVEFGSEAYYSGNNVTFSAGGFSMQIWVGEPPAFELDPIGKDCAKPSGPVGPQGTVPKKGSGLRKGGSLDKQIMITASMLPIVLIVRSGDFACWLTVVAAVLHQY